MKRMQGTVERQVNDMGISTAQRVVDIALKYLGCTQGSAKQKELIKIFNKVKPNGYTAHYTDPWCAEAWSAWQIEAGNTAKEVPLSASCSDLIQKAKKLGIWVENDAAVPEIGWGILYDWNDSGKGDNTGSPDHVGLVYAVDKKWIYVVEGNKGSASVCGKRAIQINGRFIRGFIAPKYAKSGSSIAKPAAKKTVDQIAEEVIAGKWGSGTERKTKLEKAGYNYAAIQSKVNELLAKKQTTKTVTYTVKKGDTLSSIAKKYGTTYQAIAKENGIKDASKIYAGQKIKVTTKK